VHPGCNTLRSGKDARGTVDEPLVEHILRMSCSTYPMATARRTWLGTCCTTTLNAQRWQGNCPTSGSSSATGPTARGT
jgi:hypothetical protein